VRSAILLEGKGEYQPDANNAHGDPADSWPVFLNEIIEAKKNSNNLKNCRPKLVMANGLGLDFQFSHDKGLLAANLPSSIDEIWISVCGIDETLETCQRISKQSREGYSGSGL
jgi:hypothetical protein